MFTSGPYTVVASATTEHQSDIISNPASRQVAAAEFQKLVTLRLPFYPRIDHDSNSKNSNSAPVNISAFSRSSAEQI